MAYSRDNRKSVAPRRPAAAAAARRFVADERGQSLVFAAFTLFALLIVALMILGVERSTTKKIHLQNVADAAVLAAVHVEADALAQIAWINEAMTSVYYDLMRACVDTAAAAVPANFQHVEGMHTWKTSPDEIAPGGGQTMTPPESLIPANATERWRAIHSDARQRVPRAEKWLRRLGQVERTIALLTPELMRHQMMYAARRNLAGDSAEPSEYRDSVRVASHPDLNADNLHTAGESKTFTFISDQEADYNKAVITKIGTAREYPNGWTLDAMETNNVHMNFQHTAHSDRGTTSDEDSTRQEVRTFFSWGSREVSGWHDAWEAGVTRGETSIEYVVKLHLPEKDRITSLRDDEATTDVLLRMGGEGVVSGEKLIRHWSVDKPDNDTFESMERVDLRETTNGRWIAVINRTYAKKAGSRYGGNFEAGEREVVVWEGTDTAVYIGGTPSQRIKITNDGTPNIWNTGKGEYEEPPESFELSDVGGIRVPATVDDRFHMGDGTQVTWTIPIHLYFFGQLVVLQDPIDISCNCWVGCHGWVNFTHDEYATLHGTSTRTPSRDWSLVHGDRRRHRMYSVDGRDDQWVYEWIDAGPALADMPGKRFGYHAIMDRLHPGRDYRYPRPGEGEDEEWRELLADRDNVPLWAALAEPESEDDADAEADGGVDEPFGGWFDIAKSRPQGTSPQRPVLFSRTVPCWFCGNKGIRLGQAIVDVFDGDDRTPHQRSYNEALGFYTGCGFWHEVYGTVEAWDARIERLREAGASYRAYGPDVEGNPYESHMVQVLCPLRCRRAWNDDATAAGSRPAQLLGFGQGKYAAVANERAIPTHVRVTLRDAATLSYTHPANSAREVAIQGGGTVAAAKGRPRREYRSVDYGYRHSDSDTHWTRDFFGVFLNNPQARDEERSGDYPDGWVFVANKAPADEDGEITDFWDQANPPLEIASRTGELFRTGLTVLVWNDLDDWMRKLWPEGEAPVHSDSIADGHKQAVFNEMHRPVDSPTERRPGRGAGEAQLHWQHGRSNPIAEAPWAGLFAFSSARVFYPPLNGSGSDRRRYNFDWENTDTDKKDLLERVINPRRDDWLDSPVNLFDPDWRAGLVPLGAALDLRDYEVGEMTGESDLQYFLRREMANKPFRYSVAVADNFHTGTVADGTVAGPHYTWRNQLLAPPMQKGISESGRVDWTESHAGSRGIEQAVSK